ncbi:NAD-dependent epimerase/dehydratase family protein [Pseudomonas sp. NPDC090203]|uniref:NAD-dependent epimerase/dehydratase family protein n=1 Tax=Pseudomonas sp. NPDC090203 TaxID=3364477 RepID=UPI003808539D
MAVSILVTGASGFLGRALVAELSTVTNMNLVAATRADKHLFPDVTQRPSLDLCPDSDHCELLRNIDVVIHTAARVHVMNDTAADPLALFREVNTAGTLNLARQAAAAGVRRFIFISSIKVNGESTARGQCFHPDDLPNPLDHYGASKHEAEQGLLALARDSAMDVVIIRPVLVYGPGVKANFLQLMRVLNKGIPLPLGAIDNRRSLVSLDNLVDFIKVCIEHPAAANQVFLVSDGDDLSTTGLARKLVTHLHAPNRLIPVPQPLLYLGAALLGRTAAAQRVLGSLCVDIGKNRDRLQWTPPVSVDDGLRKTVEHFLATEQK